MNTFKSLKKIIALVLVLSLMVGILWTPALATSLGEGETTPTGNSESNGTGGTENGEGDEGKNAGNDPYKDRPDAEPTDVPETTPTPPAETTPPPDTEPTPAPGLVDDVQDLKDLFDSVSITGPDDKELQPGDTLKVGDYYTIHLHFSEKGLQASDYRHNPQLSTPDRLCD